MFVLFSELLGLTWRRKNMDELSWQLQWLASMETLAKQIIGDDFFFFLTNFLMNFLTNFFDDFFDDFFDEFLMNFFDEFFWRKNMDELSWQLQWLASTETLAKQIIGDEWRLILIFTQNFASNKTNASCIHCIQISLIADFRLDIVKK